MSRGKKILAALAILLSVEFLSLDPFANVCLATIHEITPQLKAAVHTHASSVKLDAGKKNENGFVATSQGKPARDFFSAKEELGIHFRSLVVRTFLPRTVFTLKVSRYISKSVLIL